jgi:hypothetical protein
MMPRSLQARVLLHLLFPQPVFILHILVGEQECGLEHNRRRGLIAEFYHHRGHQPPIPSHPGRIILTVSASLYFLAIAKDFHLARDPLSGHFVVLLRVTVSRYKCDKSSILENGCWKFEPLAFLGKHSFFFLKEVFPVVKDHTL